MQSRFRLPALAALFLSGAFSAWAADTPVKGGTLIYLEQQPHTNLYPPAGGFYPNGGLVNNITDRLYVNGLRLGWMSPTTKVPVKGSIARGVKSKRVIWVRT